MKTTELIDYLTSQGFRTYPTPNFLPGNVDESQLPALFVFSTGGYGSDDSLPIQTPTFQIIVKGKSFKLDPINMQAAEDLARDLILHLDKRIDFTVGSSRVLACRAVQSNPIPIGLDDDGRPTFSTNFVFRTGVSM